MSTTTIVVYGIALPRTALYAPAGDEWRCENGHVHASQPKFCPNCGRPCALRAKEEPTPLLRAWAASVNVDLNDYTTLSGACDEGAYRSARDKKGLLGLHVVGCDYHKNCKPTYVMGYRLTMDERDGYGSNVSDLTPEESMAYAAVYCATFAVTGTVGLYVATWSS